jgi:hypothetical protein
MISMTNLYLVKSSNDMPMICVSCGDIDFPPPLHGLRASTNSLTDSILEYRTLLHGRRYHNFKSSDYW